MKKQVLKPETWASCRGETLGYEKAVFSKIQKTWFWSSFKMSPPPKHCFLQWIRKMFTRKKNALFGSILAPVGALMFPKPYYLQWISMILERSFLSVKMSKVEIKIGQDGLKSSSSGPDSTDHTHPYRTGDRKTFVHVKPPRNLKVSLSAIRVCANIYM